jgi:CysZ protein
VSDRSLSPLELTDISTTGRRSAAEGEDGAHLVALPLYVRVPGINLVLFPTLNGYLLRRGYFEVVALRRLDAAATRTMRNRFAGRIGLGGVVIFALARVNMVAPVIATALMVHLLEMLLGVLPLSAVCSTA